MEAEMAGKLQFWVSEQDFDLTIAIDIFRQHE